MTKFQNKFRIESARRPGWDYTANGYYFVTICTKNREPFFGEIINAKMKLSEIGEIANEYWLEIPKHFSFIHLDEFVVMPNHVHGILVINNLEFDIARRGVACNASTGNVPKGKDMAEISPKRGSLSTVIRSYKSACTKTINERFINNDFGWQSRFHDYIIRDDFELENIRRYIINNHRNWKNNRNNLNLI